MGTIQSVFFNGSNNTVIKKRKWQHQKIIVFALSHLFHLKKILTSFVGKVYSFLVEIVLA